MIIKCLNINSNKIPRPVTKNIFATPEIKKNFPAMFNKHAMSALDNYAEKENIHVAFSTLDYDLFDNARMTVLSQKSSGSSEFPLNIKMNSTEDFVNSLRDIYNKVAQGVKKISE